MDKYIILTGATGNVGGEILSCLLSKNYNIIFTTRSEKLRKQLLKELQASNKFSKIQGTVVNLEDIQSVMKFISWIRKFEVNTFISCAGVDNVDQSDELTYAQILDNLKTNYIGPAMIISHLVKYWKEKEVTGNIINISSLCAIRGANKSAVYAASKAAMESFVRNIAIENARDNIFSNTIRVSATGTKLIKKDENSRIVKNGYLKDKYNLKNIPIERPINLSLLADLIEFLMRANGNINAQSINFDGGLSMEYPKYKV